MECKKETNKLSCNCSYGSCPRQGICCDCIRHHRTNGQLPACYFPEDVEKTYDRSIENFIATYQKCGKWW